MDLGLKGRTYLVTAASRGLGRATAEVLVSEGAQVVISSRSEESITRAAAEIGSDVVPVAADNAETDTAERLVATALDRFGRLDGALISVGGPPAGGLGGVTEDQWRMAFESVFVGGLRLARAVADAASEGGSIVFVLSTSVKQPLAGLAISNGLRPGLAMAAKTMADEAGSARRPRQRPAARPGRHRAGPRARRNERRPGSCTSRPRRDDPAAPLRPARGVRPGRDVPAVTGFGLHHRRDAPSGWRSQPRVVTSGSGAGSIFGARWRYSCRAKYPKKASTNSAKNHHCRP